MINTNIIRDKKGVSLVYVMLVLIVMSILSVAIFSLFISNLNQIKTQEDSVKAHFIAMSGVEVAFAALIQVPDGEQSILQNHFNKSIMTNVSSISDTIVLNGGEADIVISSYIEDGLRFVRITSLGKLDSSSFTKELRMHFRIEYPELQIWE